MEINPALVAEQYRAEIRNELGRLGSPVKLAGLLASSDASSQTYSQYMKLGCEKVGVVYDEIAVEINLIESEILRLNQDTNITGVIVYYPIFGEKEDHRLRGLLSPFKDVEGLHTFWLNKLYANDRSFNSKGEVIKSLLPCTPLAVVKLLEHAGMFTRGTKCLEGKVVSIFNRSEVVGRPLAHMLANDGAKVFSFDISGVVEFDHITGEKFSNISRKEALISSDIVITGVPSSNFDLIKQEELKKDVCCVNFSSIENFSIEVRQNAKIYIPRVGPVTVAMCLRNLLRMAMHFKN